MKFLLDMGLARSTRQFLQVSQSRLPSVITFRLKDMRPTQVNAYLSRTLARFETDLGAGALISVSDGGIRVRRLPIAP